MKVNLDKRHIVALVAFAFLVLVGLLVIYLGNKIQLTLEEYLMTIGLAISFAGTLIGLFISRTEISKALKKAGLEKSTILFAIAIMLVFILAELALVAPTQRLFFDDVIYQGMAVNILSSGQAWFCNYGTPMHCIFGQAFHEPIGEAFDLALGFAAFGISKLTAFYTQFFTSALAVFLTFLVSLLIFKDKKVALLSELFMALSPIMLVWAVPTTSDMPALMYTLLAIFSLLIFVGKKGIKTFSLVLFSISLVAYTKIDSLLLIPVAVLIYLILDNARIIASIKTNLKRAVETLATPKTFLIILLFLLLISPEIIYVFSNLGGSYGYTGTNIPLTCTSNTKIITATGTINLQNFEANICSNLLFWINKYSGQYIIQPVIYTIFLLAGAILLIIRKRSKEFFAIAIWLLAFFIIYTAFYAGSVTFGVDWRFMLAVIPAASIFAGFGAASIYEFFTQPRLFKGKEKKRNRKLLQIIVLLAILTAIAYPLFGAAPLLRNDSSDLIQGGSARAYENFIYNYSSQIPRDCIVFTYDPPLFNINGLSAAQMYYVQNSSIFWQIYRNYPCVVIDYGYWCYTPDNICNSTMSQFTVSEIASSKYYGSTFKLFKVTGFTPTSNLNFPVLP